MILKGRIFTHAVGVLAILAFPVRLSPQSTHGAIAGVVKDATGAVIPGARVTAIEQQTGKATSVSAQLDGAFLVPQLLPATYGLAAEAQGFKRLVIDGLKVDANTTLTQDLVLQVGATTESVEVVGQSSLVETTSGQVGTTVQVSHMLEMPLVDRNVFSLTNLVPGSFVVDQSVSLGGGRLCTMLALIDGVNNTRGGLAQTNIEIKPPVESMQEFTVLVNSYGAEFGRSVGGVVSAATKSGTNQFHGAAYEFLRNDKFDARGWGNDVNPPLRRNNFGAAIGGPIRKNKTFFFYNFDGLREHNPITLTRNAGLPEWRKGDFTTLTRDAGGRATAVVIYDPETGTGTFTTPLGTSPFPGNVIPTNRLDPVAVKALSYLPAPNRAPNNPFNQGGNWQENTANITTRDYHILRIDHELSGKTRIFGRYMLGAPNDKQNGYSKGYGPADPNAVLVQNLQQNLALNATHIFSPTRFLNFTMGFNRVLIRRKSGDCCSTDYGKLLGLPNVPGEVFPRFSFGGGLVPVDAIGPNSNGNRTAAETNFDYTASITEIRGKHTLKYGIQYGRYNGNDHTRSTPGGSWTSNGQFTRGVQANGSAIANTGANLADFLLGQLSAASASVAPSIGKRLQPYAGYIQDDWRVTPRLTLNFGLRYETETPAYEVANRMSNFNPYVVSPLAGTGTIPAGAMGVTDFENRNGVGKYLWNWNVLNFGPRFGFAWRIFGTNDTVVRGGFGLFFGDAYDAQIVQNLKNGFNNTYTAPVPIATRLREGLPANALADIDASQLVPTFGQIGTPFATSSAQYLDQNRKTPHTMNFNLTVQHEWKGILFEVAGMGNLGRQVNFSNINMNRIPEQLLSQTQIPERLRRPFTIFTGNQSQVSLLCPNWGISNYWGFTFKSERRYKNGLGWVVSYAFTRWIDNLNVIGSSLTGDEYGDQIQNVYNRKAERSNSITDIPHRLVVAPIYELPWGAGRKWLKSGLLSQIVGGWQVATIGTLQSGFPFGLDVLNGPAVYLGDQASGALLRPDLVSSQILSPNKGKPAVGVRGIQYLNPNAFAIPAKYKFGNSARTLPGVFGPGMVSFDLMLAKNFIVRERWRSQFRWEAFNFTNTPQWNLPARDVGSGDLGIVTGASGRRIMQFALKLYW